MAHVRCFLLLVAGRPALAGLWGDGALVGGLFSQAPQPELAEFGEQLVIDADTSGLAYVKVRPLPPEAGPFSWALSSDQAEGAAPTPSPAQTCASTSCWEQSSSSSSITTHSRPVPSPLPAPSPAPDGQSPGEGLEGDAPPGDAQPPGDPSPHKWPPREGWPPLLTEGAADWRLRDCEPEREWYPARVVYHPHKAEKAAAYAGVHHSPSTRGSVLAGGGLFPASAPLATAETLVWTWRHPTHKWATILTGVAIDAEMNIYCTCFDAIRKLNVEGRLLWERIVQPSWCVDSPCLFKGGLYGSLCTGEVFAMDIEDGSWIWLTKVSYSISQDNGFVSAYGEHVVAEGDACADRDSGSRTIFCLATADGELHWKFAPDNPVWNFGASFPGDSSVVFQDLCGKAYRLALEDGVLFWKNGGVEPSWTDGTLTLGSNKIVYAVGVSSTMGLQKTPGTLTAYRLEDGVQLWQQITKFPPNNAPAVGPLRPGAALSVVQPIGQQCMLDSPTGVCVYNAATGEPQWEFFGPKLQWRPGTFPLYQAADPQGAETRVVCGVRDQSAPNPWGSPTIGADGTIYVGNQDGQFYCLRQSTQPARSSFRYRGHWQGVCHAGKGCSVEVCAFETFACFGGSSAPAVAPGLLVVPSIDRLYVFRDPSMASQPKA